MCRQVKLFWYLSAWTVKSPILCIPAEQERFLDYLKNVIIPTLHKGDIVVMDNMRSHHVKGVEEVLRAAGMIPLYLPPYSPDLNPIEMLWSKMKAILRKLGCKIAAPLPQMVAQALALVSPEDCFGWFTADGY